MSLREEALGIVSELGLLGTLGRHGRAELVGSVALDLIVKLDIDVHLLVESRDLYSVANQIYPELLRHPKVDEVRITDYKDGSVKIGVDRYPSASGAWSIDLYITNQPEKTAFSYVNELRDRLDEETRGAIMDIKRHYHRRGLLRDGLSHRIYEAVVRRGARTVADFQKLSP
jgi:hypothetical protein